VVVSSGVSDRALCGVSVDRYTGFLLVALCVLEVVVRSAVAAGLVVHTAGFCQYLGPRFCRVAMFFSYLQAFGRLCVPPQ